MSYSFQLPEDDPFCECKYDKVHDRMDREDCPYHCDTADDSEPAIERKPPARISGVPGIKNAQTSRSRRGEGPLATKR